MPFKPQTAAWWKRIANNQCQCLLYDEKHGVHICGKPAEHIHHLKPEGTALMDGEDPERAIGLPLCKWHHVKNVGEEEYSDDFSFHPDAGRAYKDYAEWKRQNLHMQAITGKISRKTPRQSPFEDMVDEHHRIQKAGGRYQAGSPELEDWYIQHTRDLATRYLAEHPEDSKPRTVSHPRYDPTKRKKHWYDRLF